MTAILNYRMTATLRYRTMLVLAVFSFCCGIGASLTWVYVLYSREVSNSIVTAILILMMALTGASFLLARFAKKRLRTIASAN
jgi:hypothetical protein